MSSNLINCHQSLPFLLFPRIIALSLFSFCSLEHLVTSLKSPTQPTNTNHHHFNNHANNANKNSLPSEFLQPQQHQLQIQINGGDGTKRRNEDGNHTTGKLLSPKTAKASQVMLSSATGPVTDL